MLTTITFAASMWAAGKTTTPKTTGAGVADVLFFVVIALVFYMFFLRPRSQAARRQRDTLMELSPGDEVLTGAGIFGTVLDVEPDRVTLETAPGTRITVVRSTIARRITDTGGSSVAEQNWQDEGHDGVAEAAGWHDPGEDDPADHGPADHGPADHSPVDHKPGDNGAVPEAGTDEPETDGAPDKGQGSGR
jgi:preprotein translocase subunit YajC